MLSPKVHFIQNITGSLSNYSKMRVLEVVELMNKYPELKLKVIAYGDYTSKSSYNKSISKQRATTVYKILLANGIKESRLQIEFYKENLNKTNETLERVDLKNRRVEFMVIE